MKSIRSVLVTLSLALLTAGTSSGLGHISVLSVLAPDTAFTLIPDSFVISFKNADTLLFNGLISTSVKVGAASPIVISSDSVILPPNAVQIISYSGFFFAPPIFQPGDNIVVVWPTGSGLMATDSITIHIFVVDNTGIQNKDSDSDHSYLLFPNPVRSEIHLKNTGKVPIERVRIIDLLGNEIYFSTKTDPLIDVSPFRNGNYFLEIIFADRRRKVQKLVLQD